MAAAPAPEVPRPETPPTPARRPAAALASRSTSQLVGAIGAGVVVAAAVVGWWVFQSGSPRAAAAAPIALAPSPVRYVPASAPAAEPPLTADRLTPAPTGSIDLALAPGSAGSRDSSAVFPMPPGAVVVRIQIDHEGAARERYAVILSSRGLRVWAELNMAPRAPGAKGATLQIPTASLPAGEYHVTLSGGELQAKRLEPLADYSLRVR